MLLETCVILTAASDGNMMYLSECSGKLQYSSRIMLEVTRVRWYAPLSKRQRRNEPVQLLLLLACLVLSLIGH